MEIRKEKDSLGEMEIPAHLYYGAQTARSLQFFTISSEKLPLEMIYAIALIKKAAASVNEESGLLSAKKRELIHFAAEKIVQKELDLHFPLSLWQTGSGTQSHMNVNEVIAYVATQKGGGKELVHPIDDVNKSQSSNDVFPTAMSMVAVDALTKQLLPAAHLLHKALTVKSREFREVVKLGRTHLMDAVPLSLGAEFSAYAFQIQEDILRIESSLPALSELAIGGTAVGTGLNAPEGFGKKMAERLAKMTALPLTPSRNTYAALASHDPLVASHAMLKTLATSLFKIATDLAWMVSGPASGLSELTFPANEPGSSIMAGKVNPTQCEAMLMVCTQVFGNDTSISIAGSRGNFELNVFKPLLIYNFLQSIRLLTDAMHSFTERFVVGLKACEKRLERVLAETFMLATSLVPRLGYEKVANIVHRAQKEGISLREATLATKELTAKEYDLLVDPKKMIGGK